MELVEYLMETGKAPTLFARECGLSEASIYRYLRGERCSLIAAMKIVKATQGKVTIEELRRKKNGIQKN